MLKIIANKHIEWSISDTFALEVAGEAGAFAAGSTCSFQIAPNAETAAIVTKSGTLADGIFTLPDFDSNERGKLTLGDYIYRIVITESDVVTTEISGNFIVKWGA